MTVMFVEQQWFNSIGDHRLDCGTLWTATRYVDNRFRASLAGPALAYHDGLAMSDRSMRTLHAIGFYGETVSLEHEKGFDLVGVSLWTEGLHVKSICIAQGSEHLTLHIHGFTLPQQ